MEILHGAMEILHGAMEIRGFPISALSYPPFEHLYPTYLAPSAPLGNRTNTQTPNAERKQPIMHIRETDIDEQLNRLENIEGGEVFFCGSRTNRNAFHNKTVAKLTQNTEITHALLIFEDGIPRPRVERTTQKIGSTIEAFNRAIDVDILFNMPRELFDRIRDACNA